MRSHRLMDPTTDVHCISSTSLMRETPSHARTPSPAWTRNAENQKENATTDTTQGEADVRITQLTVRMTTGGGSRRMTSWIESIVLLTKPGA